MCYCSGCGVVRICVVMIHETRRRILRLNAIWTDRGSLDETQLHMPRRGLNLVMLESRYQLCFERTHSDSQS